jgi:hypothetical protein
MKIATTDISTRELTKLSCRGAPWFNALRALWQQRTRYEPVSTAEHVARVAARKARWTNWPLYLMALVLIPLLLMRLYISNDDADGVVLVIGVMLIIICIAISQLVGGRCNDGSRMYPRSALQFGECLSYFLKETGNTPDDLGNCDIKDLRDLARELLVLKIGEFVAVERTPLEIRLRMQDFASYLESYRQVYKEAHRYLLDLGLVRPAIDQYFKETEKRLESKTWFAQ